MAKHLDKETIELIQKELNHYHPCISTVQDTLMWAEYWKLETVTNTWHELKQNPGNAKEVSVIYLLIILAAEGEL